MPMARYGADGANLTLFGIPISEFGDTDPPITIEPISPRAALKYGNGGTTVRLDRIAQPKRVTVNLMPGSVEARQLLAAAKSGVDATGSFTQTGTAETYAFFDGVLENRGPATRAGVASVSDEQFIFIFGDSEET